MVQSIFEKHFQPMANYDWADLQANLGYVIYYGCSMAKEKQALAANYVLINNELAFMIPFVSERIDGGFQKTYLTVADGAGAGGAPVVCIDADFDLEAYKTPRVIEGDALITLTILKDVTNSIDEMTCTVRVRKWDGATETEIANDTFNDVTFNVDTQTIPFKITIPKTHFKIGEQLRVSVEIKTEDADQIGLCHDPNGNATTLQAETTEAPVTESRLRVAIPYKIQL